jgi:hypothetical protein
MSAGRITLPGGKACKDCAHFSRCSWLVGAKPDWTSCDFNPHRFELASEVVPKTPAKEDAKHGQD